MEKQQLLKGIHGELEPFIGKEHDDFFYYWLNSINNTYNWAQSELLN